jgi:hypothetical protein
MNLARFRYGKTVSGSLFSLFWGGVIPTSPDAIPLRPLPPKGTCVLPSTTLAL